MSELNDSSLSLPVTVLTMDVDTAAHGQATTVVAEEDKVQVKIDGESEDPPRVENQAENVHKPSDTRAEDKETAHGTQDETTDAVGDSDGAFNANGVIVYDEGQAQNNTQAAEHASALSPVSPKSYEPGSPVTNRVNSDGQAVTRSNILGDMGDIDPSVAVNVIGSMKDQTVKEISNPEQNQTNGEHMMDTPEVRNADVRVITADTANTVAATALEIGMQLASEPKLETSINTEDQALGQHSDENSAEFLSEIPETQADSQHELSTEIKIQAETEPQPAFSSLKRASDDLDNTENPSAQSTQQPAGKKRRTERHTLSTDLTFTARSIAKQAIATSTKNAEIISTLQDATKRLNDGCKGFTSAIDDMRRAIGQMDEALIGFLTCMNNV